MDDKKQLLYYHLFMINGYFCLAIISLMICFYSQYYDGSYRLLSVFMMLFYSTRIIAGVISRNYVHLFRPILLIDFLIAGIDIFYSISLCYDSLDTYSYVMGVMIIVFEIFIWSSKMIILKTVKKFFFMKYDLPITDLSKQFTISKCSFTKLTCSICLIDIELGRDVKILDKCNHIFHPNCIDMWLNKQPTCPNCRYDYSVKQTSQLMVL